MTRVKIYLYFAAIIFLFFNINISSVFATITILSRKTLDRDNNGRIDAIEFTASDNLNDDFDGLVINVNSYNVSTYDTGSTSNDNTFLVIFDEVSSGYDTGVTPDVQITANTTLGNATNGLVETDSAPITPSDGASPVLVDVKLTRMLQGGNYWWNRIVLTYSEPVYCGDLAPGSDLTASDSDDESGGGFDTGHGGDYSNGVLSGYGSFSSTGDVVVPSGEVGIIVGSTGVVTFDLGRGANGHGSIESGSTAPSGSFTPVVNSGIKDGANNSLTTTTSITVTTEIGWDLTKPTINIARTYDNDHDGHIDRIEFELSEDIQDGFTPGNFNIAGYSNENFSTAVTGISGGYDGDSNDNRFSITFTERAQYDTSNKPTYRYTGSSIYLVDLAGNRLDNITGGTTEDGAPPAFSSITTADSDKNGHIDEIILEFSEDVTITDSGGDGDGLDCINIGSSYTISDWDYSGSVTQGNSLILKINEKASYDTGVTPSVSYNTGGSSTIEDGASIEMLNGETTITVDGAVPLIVGNAETVDYDHDGRIDHYKIDFSEPMNDSSFGSPAYGGFSVAGHNITGIGYIYGDGLNDSTVYLTIDETGFDTGDTPEVTTSSVSATDLAGNILNGGTDYGTGDITEVDASPPAFSSITTADSDKNGHIDEIILEFSEDVTITDSGGDGDGLDCINIGSSYTISDWDYSGSVTQGNSLILKINEKASYDTGVTPSVSYNTGGSSTIEDGASIEMLNGETDTTVDGAGPYLLSATYHDLDENDVDQGDTITLEFSEAVKLQGGCTDASDFTLPNSAYGDTFGTGAYLSDSNPGDNEIEIVLGNDPSFILPNIWSGTGQGNPSGIGVKSGGTSCLLDLSDNSAADTPIVDIGGSGSNQIVSVVVSDGSDTFSNPDINSTLLDTDISVSIVLQYKALHVTVWYDVGRDPDGLGTQNNEDRSITASGSEKNWIAQISGDDSEIVEGALVRFIINVDGELYYSDGPSSQGGHTPWYFTILYEQKDRITVRNNIINPQNGDLLYINYYLSKNKRVRIEIFDLAGNRVKTLKNRTESSGSHLVTWNGKNRRGETCIPGVYYILIKVDKKRYVKKVLIVK